MIAHFIDVERLRARRFVTETGRLIRFRIDFSVATVRLTGLRPEIIN